MKHPTDRMPLPMMQCDDGCGACCGPAQCQTWEYQRIEAFAAKNKLMPVRQGITCPWFQGGKCSVYEVRPFVCRMFGHSPKTKCVKGYAANIPRNIEKLWRDRYLKDSDGEMRFLHEVLGEGWADDIIAYLGELTK